MINLTFLLTIRGSAAANTISQYSLAVLLFFYIQWKGLHKNTWDGEYLSIYLSILVFMIAVKEEYVTCPGAKYVVSLFNI